MKPRNKPDPKDIRSPGEALRILASLIAQSHFKKIAGFKKPDIQEDDNGDLNNE